MEKITSAKNPTVRSLRDLKDKKTREETGRILIEGEVMIREALACGLKIYDLLADEKHEGFAAEMEAQGARAFGVPRSILEAVCETRTPQGVCASFSRPQQLTADEMPDIIVALDGVQDPGNVGTIIRTADCAGIEGVLLSEQCADIFSPKVLRATMGSIFRMPMLVTGDLPGVLSGLVQDGYHVLSSQLDGEPFYQYSGQNGRYCLVIGSEGNGVSEPVRALATHRVKLPMRGGAESLNAAVAAGIMMYHLTREDDL